MLKKREAFKEIKQEIDENLLKIDGLLNNLANTSGSFHQIQQLLKKYSEIQIGTNFLQNEEPIHWKHQKQYDMGFIEHQYVPLCIEKVMEMNVSHTKIQINSVNSNDIVSDSKRLMYPFIRVPCHKNWIQKYLDHPKTIIYGLHFNNTVHIVNEKQKKVILSPTSDLSQKIQIQLSQLYDNNNEVIAYFPGNKFVYELGNSIIKLNNSEPQTFLLHLSNYNAKLPRILIFRADNQNLQSYQFFCGFYEHEDFMTSIDLSVGTYIFMPISDTVFNLYSQKNLSQSLSYAKRQPIKELNLMLQGFKQCHPESINSQFMRICDLDSGIIMEVYRNLHNKPIYFKDQQNEQSRKQDKQLMFGQLYPNRIKNWQLKNKQTMVYFYEVTKKPAILNIPKKLIYDCRHIGKQAKTVHSILK